MHRREFLAGCTLLLSGCSEVRSSIFEETKTSSEGDTDKPPEEGPQTTAEQSNIQNLPPEQTHGYDEWVRYNDIRLKARRIDAYDSIEYNNPETATIEEWNPGPDRQIVVPWYRVENLGTEELAYPTWENFHLVTPDEILEPIVEAPDGTSLEEVTSESAMIHWIESEGLDGNYERGWTGVFDAPKEDLTNFASKWTRPEEPVYWQPSQEHIFSGD